MGLDVLGKDKNTEKGKDHMGNDGSKKGTGEIVGKMKRQTTKKNAGGSSNFVIEAKEVDENK